MFLDRLGTLERVGHLVGSNEDWGLRGEKKKIPSKVKHINSCGLVSESQGCSGEMKVQRISECSKKFFKNRVTLLFLKRDLWRAGQTPAGWGVQAVRPVCRRARAGCMRKALRFLIFQVIHQIPVTLGPNS